MISPLGQRQILQTAAVETVRAAMEGGAQVQREQARKQHFDAKLAEAMDDVADVLETDAMRLTERQGNGRGAGQGGGTGASEEEEPPGSSPAAPADLHLDLLA